MTKGELVELVTVCPTLYHMAELGSWPSIQNHGLLSTTALLDRYEIAGAPRVAIEGKRRPTSVTLERNGLGRAVVRDQFPMDDKGLSSLSGRRTIAGRLVSNLERQSILLAYAGAPAALIERRDLSPSRA